MCVRQINAYCVRVEKTASSKKFLFLTAFALLISMQTQLFASIAHKKKQAKIVPPAQFIKPSQAPAYSIEIEPLGFAPPGAIYQGSRYAFVSLDFFDEDHLLFTFRAPGLMVRQGGDADGEQRQIRAYVLSLPSGSLQEEALWTLHGYERYLWMLDDGRYLVRDGASIKQGDLSLELKPLLHFPGPLDWVEMDPSQTYLVTNSSEPESGSSKDGTVGSPETARSTVTSDNPQDSGEPSRVLRILKRSTGKVMLVSRTRSIIHLPINQEGYLEPLRGRGKEWILNFNYFTGGSRIVGRVQSDCAPALEFIAPAVFVVTVCGEDASRGFVAVNMGGRKQWEIDTPATQVWPRLICGRQGRRLALESLAVSHPVDPLDPLSFDDVKGQLVQVYDAKTGKQLLTAPADPVLDGGGNVAISPSGRRVAVLNRGKVEVYELPMASNAHGSSPGTASK